ncbi:MAG TPA: hypothetical protein VF875_00850 [Anaeromyxobacter sp.]
MRRPLALLAVLLPLAARAEAPAPATPPAQEGALGGAPTGLTAGASLAAGGELGLDSGRAGVFELELAVGYDIGDLGLRPELAAAFGLAPDSNVAIRPGLRFELPALPVQLRAALDASTSRGGDLHWRWLLLGAAAELRLTGLFGLFAEVDTGVKLSSRAGLPLLVRTGASFRF